MLLEREAFLDVLAGPPGRLVLVGGEAGVGKTALVREFAEQSGARVLWGACDPLETPRPLGPLLDVADAAGGELLEAVAAGARPAALVTALLHELRAAPGTVLVLEDVHWADEGTLDVLRVLGRRIGERARARGRRRSATRPSARCGSCSASWPPPPASSGSGSRR